jgi:hypothetical protein
MSQPPDRLVLPPGAIRRMASRAEGSPAGAGPKTVCASSSKATTARKLEDVEELPHDLAREVVGLVGQGSPGEGEEDEEEGEPA